MQRIDVLERQQPLSREGVDMKHYMDRTWAVMEGTILTYSGADAALKIPERFADINVHAIGDGALMEAESIQQVILPRCIESVGRQAFYGCTNMINVYMPGTIGKIAEDAFGGCNKIINFTCYDIELSERRYNDLKASCRKAGGNLYVAHAFPEIDCVKKAMLSMGIKCAGSVPEGIDRLFISQNLSEDVGRASLTRNLDRFEFGKTAGRMTEIEAFLSHMGAEEYAVLDKAAELRNDAFARVEKYPDIEKTAVFTFDDGRTRTEGNKRFLTANIKIGYHFWQSKASVRYHERDYYIYRRHYLSSATDLKYIRRDTAAFSRQGLVTNRREAQEVYAKYKLLSIL